MIRTPLKRGKPLARKTPIKARMSAAFQKAGIAVGPGSTDKEAPYRAGLGRNNARAREQRALDFDGGIGHDVWITKQPCVITGSKFTVPAHVVSRGAGGRWYHLVPLTQELHDEQHRIGIKSFQKKYPVPLLQRAFEFARKHVYEVTSAELGKEAA